MLYLIHLVICICFCRETNAHPVLAVCACTLFLQDLDSPPATSLSYTRLKCLSAQPVHCCFTTQQFMVVSQCCCRDFARLFSWIILQLALDYSRVIKFLALGNNCNCKLDGASSKPMQEHALIDI